MKKATGKGKPPFAFINILSMDVDRINLIIYQRIDK